MSNDLVKQGYEKVADDYDQTRNQNDGIAYLEEFIKLIPKGKTVLDVGCGAGKPVDEFLVNHGYAVNGIDLAERMIELAKKNVPDAFYEVKDMAELKEQEYCVDGIVSFYAIFHTPKENHQEILNKLASFMPKGGPLLITMGSSDWDGTEENFHGAKMYWSHFNSEKNIELVEKAGFKVLINKIDGVTNERHQFILAQLNN